MSGFGQLPHDNQGGFVNQGQQPRSSQFTPGYPQPTVSQSQIPTHGAPLQHAYPNQPQILSQNQYATRPPQFMPPGIPYVPSVIPGYQSRGNTHSLSMSGEKTASLFIGNIPTEMTEKWIETLLGCCGEIQSWKRVIGPNGELKKFGFCEYSTLDDTLRALRLLNSENGEGLELPLSSSGERQKLLVKVDTKTRTLLDKYQESKPITEYEKHIDGIAKDRIKQLLTELYGQTGGSFDKTHEPELSTSLQNNNEQNETPSNSNVLGSVSNISQKVENTVIQNSKTIEIENTTNQNEFNNLESLEKQKYNTLNPKLAEDFEEEERKEKKYKNRRIAEKEDSYRQRERRWVTQESSRQKRIEREAERELDLMEKMIEDKKKLAYTLSTWDDRKKEREQKDEYYRNRERWWNKRKSARNYELELDDKDRKLEAEELELARSQNVNLNLAQADSNNHYTATSNSKENQDLGNLKGSESYEKMTLNNNSENIAKQQIVGNKISSGNVNNSNFGTSLNNNAPISSEEKRTILKNLISSIPVDPKELFEYPVRWNHLNEEMLVSKLKPTILKRLGEYLGQEGNSGDDEISELSNYIINHLRNHLSPKILVSELEMVLDEDAPIFVARLWRVLVFETESVAIIQ
ncbi:hypothetical protein BB558_007133 [Smittium angustum]|uniref:PWI domain-containing protein n=1 Tax=Smittium angustum TaxID=133377 RepID=A0A2U1IVU7_SMIAN|nr:hypothetical protein BB558_007133 [Smittium angustum]